MKRLEVLGTGDPSSARGIEGVFLLFYPTRRVDEKEASGIASRGLAVSTMSVQRLALQAYGGMTIATSLYVGTLYECRADVQGECLADNG